MTVFLAVVPVLFGLGAQWTTLPAIGLGVAAFIWMSKRIARRVEAVTNAADQELATLQQIAQRPGANTQALMNQKFDRAVEILKRGFVLEKWQIGVSTMLNARIGMLLFASSIALPKSRMGEAIPYLENARVKGLKAKLLQGMWPAWAMLAVAYYKSKKDIGRAIEVLESTVAIAKKDALLWNLYAWILWKENRLDEAIGILVRAKDAVPDDARLSENLTALQNRKSMKMRAYGDQWYQFGLEKPKIAGMQQQMMHPRARAANMRRR